MAEQVQPDIFDPPCHKLKPGIQSKLDALPKENGVQLNKKPMKFTALSPSGITISKVQIS